MKVSINLTFNLEDESDRIKYKISTILLKDVYAIKAVLDDYHGNFIRPAYKHGYSNEEPELQKLLEDYPEVTMELTSLLWERFCQQLDEEGLKDLLSVEG